MDHVTDFHRGHEMQGVNRGRDHDASSMASGRDGPCNVDPRHDLSAENRSQRVCVGRENDFCHGHGGLTGRLSGRCFHLRRSSHIPRQSEKRLKLERETGIEPATNGLGSGGKLNPDRPVPHLSWSLVPPKGCSGRSCPSFRNRLQEFASFSTSHEAARTTPIDPLGFLPVILRSCDENGVMCSRLAHKRIAAHVRSSMWWFFGTPSLAGTSTSSSSEEPGWSSTCFHSGPERVSSHESPLSRVRPDAE